MRYTKVKDLQFEFYSQDHVFENTVLQENYNQLQKWGVQHATLFEWLAWTVEEFGEFAKALNEFVYGRAEKEPIIKEGIQTVTLLLKMLEILENLDEAITEVLV